METQVLDLKGQALDQLSRMIEGAFRDFQMGFRGPSHVYPPFKAKPIDIFLQTPLSVAASNVTAPAPPTTIVNQTVPAGAWRGVFTGIGMSAESESAWADLQFDITINGVPQTPYNGIKGQLGLMSRPATIFLPFQSRNVVGIRVTNLGSVAHLVMARLTGWFYEVRSECGDVIESTIAD